MDDSMNGHSMNPLQTPPGPRFTSAQAWARIRREPFPDITRAGLAQHGLQRREELEDDEATHRRALALEQEGPGLAERTQAYRDRRRAAAQAFWGHPRGYEIGIVLSAVFWISLGLLAASLSGCGLAGPVGVPGPVGEGDGGGTGGSGEGSSSGASSGTRGEIGGGSGGMGSDSGSAEGSSSTGEPDCAVNGLECLCGDTPSDPFDCVDECLWTDFMPDCMCDGTTAPPEWCESAPCALEGAGDRLECVCAGLADDPARCVVECIWSDDACICDDQPAPTEWCDQ